MLEDCVSVLWVWWRFLDDIFLIWLHVEARPKELFEIVNSYYYSIKYTWVFSAKEITYLDVKVDLDGSNLVI